MRVLVLDGNQNQAVACVRSLARRGHTVLVGDTAPWSKAGWSRFASGSFQYPLPEVNAEQCVRELARKVCDAPPTLVIPGSDATTLLVSTYRDTLLTSGGRLVLPEHSDLLLAMDKDRTTQLAAQLGAAVPETLALENQEAAEAASRDVAYPVVLKPRSSEELAPESGTRTAGRPKYASNPQEFVEAYNALRSRTSSVLVQEFIAGRGAGYFALFCRGELRTEFAHQRIRDVHPTGSGSAVRESVRPNAKVREAALAILKALNWHGVAMVEFRLRADGTPVFLEVNPRFWNSLPLACYAGADFPAMLAEIAEHGDVDPAADYRSGVRCRWFLGDTRHLFGVWAGPPAGYPGRFPSRWKTLAEFLTPVPGTYHDNFIVADPLPELGDWLAAARRVWRRRSAERDASC